MKVKAHAPGRVNLIGDHTDYTGGLAMPMAIDLGTTIALDRGGEWLELVSDVERDPITVEVPEPNLAWARGWGRYVAGVVDVIRPATGGRGFVTTTLPLGAGLSSSAALEVSLAMALAFERFEDDRVGLARACQQAEERSSGVPCGLLDQLCSAAGVDGHALLIDFETLDVDPVALPEGIEVVVVESGVRRQLTGSSYGIRRAQCEEAAAVLGPLRHVTVADVDAERRLEPVLRRRARHVVTENERVSAFATALRDYDLPTAGELMVESHASLREQFEVSTPELDELVARLVSVPGVYGARLTGAGFGGCVVALGDEGVADTIEGAWHVSAVEGAWVEILEG